MHQFEVLCVIQLKRWLYLKFWFQLNNIDMLKWSFNQAMHWNNEYSDDSKHFDKTNKKVMENLDTRGIPITEFILLRSKMYSYMKDNDKTAKGIKKNVISKNIAHVNYKITLFNNEQMYHKMNIVRSMNHELGCYKLTKVFCFDD